MSLQQQQQQQSLSVYPETLSDNDWASLLQDNLEARGLLSNAIAHHQEHYRPEEDQLKRSTNRLHESDHLHHKSDHYGPDLKSGNDDSINSDGEDSSDETSAQMDGKPAPKKAGRKPLTTEPTNKRKAQNRAAQRAFRERKEKYVKSLEDRIKELEDMQQPNNPDSMLAEENLNLKVLVQKLETENYFLKERSFTFDFPISQPGLYQVANAQQEAAPQGLAKTQQLNHASLTATAHPVDANANPQTTTTSTANSKAIASSGVKSAGGERQPWTPPSSGGDSVPNSPLDNDISTPEQDSISQVSYPDNAGVVPRYRNTTPEGMSLFSSLLDGSGNTYNNAAIATSSSINNSSNTII
ncbi:DNA-binding transcription factor yap1, partial [Modicella reniformis]